MQLSGAYYTNVLFVACLKRTLGWVSCILSGNPLTIRAVSFESLQIETWLLGCWSRWRLEERSWFISRHIIDAGTIKTRKGTGHGCREKALLAVSQQTKGCQTRGPSCSFWKESLGATRTAGGPGLALRESRPPTSDVWRTRWWRGTGKISKETCL